MSVHVYLYISMSLSSAAAVSGSILISVFSTNIPRKHTHHVSYVKGIYLHITHVQGINADTYIIYYTDEN